jgi:hypothetical protein
MSKVSITAEIICYHRLVGSRRKKGCRLILDSLPGARAGEVAVHARGTCLLELRTWRIACKT